MWIASCTEVMACPSPTYADAGVEGRSPTGPVVCVILEAKLKGTVRGTTRGMVGQAGIVLYYALIFGVWPTERWK